MGFDLEKRVATELNRLVDEEAKKPEQDAEVPRPGKQTRVEKFKRLAAELERRLLDRGADAGGMHASALPGKHTQIEEIVEGALAALQATVGQAQRTLASVPFQTRSPFDDYRATGLREVLDTLGATTGKRRLQETTIAAADPAIVSRATRSRATATPDASGRAMWRASERHAATLYRNAMDAGEVATEDPVVAEALARCGSGQPLAAAVRKKMEAELGISLERVRVHTDRVAADAARAVRAEAFTVGEDIFFADSAYAPDSRDGQKLIAHELAHVVQAWEGRTRKGGDSLHISSPGEALEQEAEAIAERIDQRGAQRSERDDQRGDQRGDQRERQRTDRTQGDRLDHPQSKQSARRAETPLREPRALPQAAPAAPAARSSSLLRKAAGDQAPQGKAGGANAAPGKEPRGTVPTTQVTRDRAVEQATKKSKQTTDRMEGAGAELTKRVDGATKQSLGQLKQGVQAAKANPPGKKAGEAGKVHEKKAQQAKQAAAAKAAKANAKVSSAKHDTAVPQVDASPSNTGEKGPVKFKKVGDWTPYMPEPLPDQDERERKRIQKLVEKKVNEDRRESAAILNHFRQAQIKQAGAVRAMAPGLQAKIAGAQSAAIGQVSASESAQSAAVQGHVASVQAQVRAHAAAMKGQITSAHAASLAQIRAATQAANQKLVQAKTQAITDIGTAETAQIAAVAAEFLAAKTEIIAMGATKSSEAAGLGSSVSLPYDGEKLEAAQKAAKETAAAYASAMPEEASKAAAQLGAEQPKTESDVRKIAADQRKAVNQAFDQAKQTIEQADKQAQQSADQTKTSALAGIDSVASSTSAQLAAHGASQVAAIRQQGAAARAGIAQAGAAAKAGVAKAVAAAASGIEKGAQGVVAGAKNLEAPNPETTRAQVAQGTQELQQGSSQVIGGLKKNADQSAAGLTKQASGAASGMAQTAAAAKQGATAMGQGAQQSMTSAAQGAQQTLTQVAQGHKQTADQVVQGATDGFKQLVQGVRDAYTAATTQLRTGLKGAVTSVGTSFNEAVPTKETADIQANAKKAADAVKPWWKKALAFVVSVIVAIVVVVVITALIVTTGPVGAILVGAAAGALGSVAGQMASNLVLGNSLMEGVTWQSVAMGAIGGGVAAGLTAGLSAGAGQLAAGGGRFAASGARITTAMGGGSGLANYGIRLGVNVGSDFVSDAAAQAIVTGKYEFSTQNLITSIGTNAITSTRRFEAVQQSAGGRVRAAVGLPPINVNAGGGAGSSASGGAGSSASGGGGTPSAGGGAGATPGNSPRPSGGDGGGAAPRQAPGGGDGASPTPRPAGGGSSPQSAGSDGAGPTPRPAGGDGDGGQSTPRPAGDQPAGGQQAQGGQQQGGQGGRPSNDNGTAPQGDAPQGGRPANDQQGAAGGDQAGTPRQGGDQQGAQAQGDGPRPQGGDGARPQGGDGPRPQGDGAQARGDGDQAGGQARGNDQGGQARGNDQGGQARGNDQGGQARGNDQGGQARGGDDAGPAGGDRGGNDQSAGSDRGGDGNDSQSARGDGDDATPTSAQDAELNDLGYPNATKAKGEEAAGAIESGQKPKSDQVRDTEANQQGLRDLEALANDPKLTPEQRAQAQRDLAQRLRGQEEPTGNLQRDVAEQRARTEAEARAQEQAKAQQAGAKPADGQTSTTKPADGTTPDGTTPSTTPAAGDRAAQPNQDPNAPRETANGTPEGPQQGKLPNNGEGLADPTAIDRFAGKMRDIEAQWAGMSPDARAAHLQETVRAELAAAGLPDVPVRSQALNGNNGEFDPASWQVRMDEGRLANATPAEVANTLYHEIRHMEQFYRIAQELRLQGMDPATIHQTTGIPDHIIQAAGSDPHPLTPDQRAQAQSYFDSMYTNSAGNRATRQRLYDAGAEVNARNADYERINNDPAASHADKVAAYDRAMQAFHDYETAMAGYKSLPEEADAFRAGDAAEAAINAGRTPQPANATPDAAGAGNANGTTASPTRPRPPSEPTTAGGDRTPTGGDRSTTPDGQPNATGDRSAASGDRTTAAPETAPKPAGSEAPRQGSNDLDQLYRDAAVAQQELSGITRTIADDLGGRPLIPDRLKGRERAQQKIDADYGGDPGRITDLARSSIEFDNPAQIRQAVEQLRAAGEVVRVKDRFESPADGYRDVMMNVRMSNGHIVEVQLHLKAILDVKNGAGHHLYEQVRTIDANAKTEGRPLTPHETAERARLVQEMTKLYDDAYAAAGGQQGAAPRQPTDAPPADTTTQTPRNTAQPGDVDAPRAPQGDQPARVIRQDNNFGSETNRKGQAKPHIDGDGNLVPANPNGNATILEHVIGRSPAKDDSPYTSFMTVERGVAKTFGSQEIELSFARLQADIQAGRIAGVEVVTPAMVQSHIRADIESLHPGFDTNAALAGGTPASMRDYLSTLGLSKTKQGKLMDRLMALHNTARDGEWLIKGTVPSTYFDGPRSTAAPNAVTANAGNPPPPSAALGTSTPNAPTTAASPGGASTVDTTTAPRLGMPSTDGTHAPVAPRPVQSLAERRQSLAADPNRTTAEAYSNIELPAGPKAQKEVLRDPNAWTPERQALHTTILERAAVDAQAFADAHAKAQTDSGQAHQPEVFAMRGNTASGKTRAVKQGLVPELEAPVQATNDLRHRAVNPDNFKIELYGGDGAGLTASQVHLESSILAERHSQALTEMKTSSGETGSILIDKRLGEVKDVTNLQKVAGDTGRGFTLVDVDAPLGNSVAGVLGDRVPGGNDPIPPFSAIAEGYVEARAHRMGVIQEVVKDPNSKYMLFATNPDGSKVLVAEVKALDGGAMPADPMQRLTILDQPRFEQLIQTKAEAEADINRLRAQPLTPQTIREITGPMGKYGEGLAKRLEPHMGKTWEQAIADWSQAKPPTPGGPAAVP